MSEVSYKVLVVDDSKANRSYLADLLEEEGYRALQAASGEECLELAAKESPVLVLLDVVMPGIDGFETLRRLKADRRTRRAAVIMLTSLGDEASKLKAFDFGAVDYIVKSAGQAEVRARVRVHVHLASIDAELVETRARSLERLALAQQSMLARPEDLPEARFSVYYRSLFEAGGDFYDVVPAAESAFLYLIADVAGHDVGTSYVTPAVKVLLPQCATPAYSLPGSMAYLNDVLSRTILQETYLTAFALRLNRRAGKAVFLAAGHPPALRIPKEGRVGFLESENPFVGMFQDTVYRAETIDASPGDRFVLYTDGLVEIASDEDGSTLPWTESRERLLPLVEGLRGLPLDDLPGAIVRAMGAEEAEDDVAVLAIEV
jgi:sigma-B regulation protein RsbU (phosphoserine phosphatase)